MYSSFTASKPRLGAPAFSTGIAQSVRELTLLLLSAISILGPIQAQIPIVKTYGIDFSPYETGQNPNLGSVIPESQILSRMKVVAPYTVWVRSFSSTGGNENTPAVARQLGLKIAANAWISSDSAQSEQEISNLIAAANAGLIDIAIVGSEAILRNDVSVAQLISYMNRVRESIPAGIPVTTADVWGTFIANPSLITASDLVFANFYPYWEGTSAANAICSLEQEYQQLLQVSGSKPVVVSETGWPSSGNAVGGAVPSVTNANTFALQFLTWARSNNIQSFYFEAFNEDWKANSEGPQGANWGIWDENGMIKPGMDAFFNGQSASASCNGMIPGPVNIAPVYVPPYGSSDAMEVQVTGVVPGSYWIATYIDVAGGWWTKPTFAQPAVTVNSDGAARVSIDTGGYDTTASEIEAFLIPAASQPPLVGNGGKPLLANAVASFDVVRTQSSISGTVTDNQGHPITGAVISDPVLGSTSSAPDGKYCFYNITTSGKATLTVNYPNYSFPTSPTTIALTSGNQIVNFSGGIPDVDLTVAASVSQQTVVSGSQVIETVVVSNAGPASATDATLQLSIPAPFTNITASTTRGGCNNAPFQPITCDLGPLAATAYATVTVNATAGGAGAYVFQSTVSGPEPDSNAANNAASQTVTVIALQSIKVSPASDSLATGSTLQFIATGNYSDNSTQDLTGSATWTTAATAIAAISSTGLATALAPGITSIKATVGNIGGSAVLTVTQAVVFTLPSVFALYGGTNSPLIAALDVAVAMQDSVQIRKSNNEFFITGALVAIANGPAQPATFVITSTGISVVPGSVYPAAPNPPSPLLVFTPPPPGGPPVGCSGITSTPIGTTPVIIQIPGGC